MLGVKAISGSEPNWTSLLPDEFYSKN